MEVRVKVAVAVPDLAGALQDDPAALVDVLSGLADANEVRRGNLADRLAMHLPQDARANSRLEFFLTGVFVHSGVQA